MSQRMAHFRKNTSHVARVGAAIFLTGTFLLASGISTVAYSQDRKTKKGGDTVLLMQTSSGQVYKPVEQAKKDTTKMMGTVPKIVKPDVRSLEHYNPYPGPGGLNDQLFIQKDKKVKAFADAWREMENGYPPFGLSKKVIDSYSPADRKELMERWEKAKKELDAAFLSDRGATPSNALKVHTPEEVKAMLRQWQELEKMDKSQHELLLRPSTPVHVK